MKAYAGIGSRRTPPSILRTMTEIAEALAGQGWVMRTGGAQGADQAFIRGVRNYALAHDMNSVLALSDLYLPWKNFEGFALATRNEPQYEAFEIAARFHPNWQACRPAATRLHARNVHQILGPDVTDPLLSKFVLCWTEGGLGGGGTGQAIRIANHYGVPVFDLAIPAVYRRVTEGVFALA